MHAPSVRAAAASVTDRTLPASRDAMDNVQRRELRPAPRSAERPEGRAPRPRWSARGRGRHESPETAARAVTFFSRARQVATEKGMQAAGRATRRARHDDTKSPRTTREPTDPGHEGTTPRTPAATRRRRATYILAPRRRLRCARLRPGVPEPEAYHARRGSKGRTPQPGVVCLRFRSANAPRRERPRDRPDGDRQDGREKTGEQARPTSSRTRATITPGMVPGRRRRARRGARRRPRPIWRR